jgi:hypothetical protein
MQGTWLIHTAFVTSSKKMSNLYFSWHILAVFITTLVINVIIQLCVKTDVKMHMTTKHTNLITTVAKIHDGLNNAYAGLTVVEQNALEDMKNKEVKRIQKSVENIADDNIAEEKAPASEPELNNSFESIPTQVLSMHSDQFEMMSPLEEFNTLHRNTEGVRKSIKMKESSIV